MRLDQFVWVAGALSLLLGCSGQYEVGKLSDGGAFGMGSGAGAGGVTGVFTGYAGGTVDVSGGSVVGSGGSSPSGTAGAAQVTGLEPYGLSPSCCGNAIPLSHITEFASPELVWTRIQKFLRGEIVTALTESMAPRSRAGCGAWTVKGTQAMRCRKCSKSRSGGCRRFVATRS